MYTLIYVSFLFACSRIYAAVDTDRLVDTAKSEQLLLSTCNMCLPDDTRNKTTMLGLRIIIIIYCTCICTCFIILGYCIFN